MLSLSLRSLVTSAAGTRPLPLDCLQRQSMYAALAAPGSLLLCTRVSPPPPPNITAPPAPSQPLVRCWHWCVPPPTWGHPRGPRLRTSSEPRPTNTTTRTRDGVPSMAGRPTAETRGEKTCPASHPHHGDERATSSGPIPPHLTGKERQPVRTGFPGKDGIFTLSRQFRNTPRSCLGERHE